MVNCDLPVESVAAFGDGCDAWASVGEVAEHFSEQGDVDGQVGFFDEAVRPDFFHQHFAGDQMSVAGNEGNQHLKGLGCERNWGLFPEQQLLGRVQPKGTKAVVGVIQG